MVIPEETTESELYSVSTDLAQPQYRVRKKAGHFWFPSGLRTSLGMHLSMDSTRTCSISSAASGGCFLLQQPLLVQAHHINCRGGKSRCRRKAEREFFRQVYVGIFPSLEQLLEWTSHS